MKIEQFQWTENEGWDPSPFGGLGDAAQLVFVFGSPDILKAKTRIVEIRKAYPNAFLFGCSTAGEICDTRVADDSLVATAVHFERARLRTAWTQVDRMEDSYAAGQTLAQSLETEDLMHVLVLSDGLKINGSDLVRGLTEHLPGDVTVTGGLSGDGARFSETLVLHDDCPMSGSITVVGLYGSALRVGYGSLGGWDSFGPERLITRSKGNVLYELDGRSALQLYKKYLGEHASGLPATGMLFPLSVRDANRETPVVRTILSVDETEQSMTFAGDVPEGAYARLMKANFDRLIDGAAGAATITEGTTEGDPPELAFLVSCVGRKMVLNQRVEEEVESVRDVLGSKTVLMGFYSYGEIAPFTPHARCELHNQTMTITTLSEA